MKVKIHEPPESVDLGDIGIALDCWGRLGDTDRSVFDLSRTPVQSQSCFQFISLET